MMMTVITTTFDNVFKVKGKQAEDNATKNYGQ